MMDVTVNELLRKKKAAQNHHITGDLVASTPKNQEQEASSKNLTGFSCAVKIGEKRKRNEYSEICNKSEGAIVNLSKIGNRTVADDFGNAREESGNGKQLHHEVDISKETLPSAVNINGQLNRKQDAQVGAAIGISQNIDANCDTSSEVAVQPKISECAGLKFNDFDKLRIEENFAVGQTWAIYDTVDGMPRLFAQIRKVSAPSFGLRITYLEPDPDNEKEIKWFEEDLPVSVGKFRLGENQNTKDRSIFSHVVHCDERSSTGRFSTTFYFSVSPRVGETWALFKNWDIKWSSEPDSHRKYEYEFVEILSDYTDEGGVYVAYLHKAKGFASVFFRMGTGFEGIFRILPQSMYRFSHRVPSYKLTGIEGKCVPKDAYELDQAALPEAIKEIIVPSNSESDITSKRQAIYFASKGKVFQTGQIWSFYSGYDDLPLYYGRIQKITFTQALKQDPVCKLHIGRLKPTRSPKDVIEWEDRGMPVGCGTFYARKVLEVITPSEVSLQIIPQTSMDGIEYTILPKIGEVWAIYRYWSSDIEVDELEREIYDIVEILDDTLDYKVQLLEKQHGYRGRDRNIEYKLFRGCTEFQEYEDEGSEPIFTIPRPERIRFSNKIPATRVTKEVDGELKDLFCVEIKATPLNCWLKDY